MDCPRCNGQGHLGIRIFVDDYKTCPECEGTGNAPEDTIAVQYYLAPPSLSFRLPYPYITRVQAEKHNLALGGGYEVIAVAQQDTESAEQRGEREDTEFENRMLDHWMYTGRDAVQL